jgi:hypothetical protein
VFAVLGQPKNLGVMKRHGEWIHFQAALSLADTRGHITHELGEVAAYEGRPLGKVTSLAVSQSLLYVGTKDSAFVDVYKLNGRRIGSIPIHIERRQPTLRHYEAAIDAMVMVYNAAEMRQQMKPVLLDMPMPDHLPPYAALLADPDGILWAVVSAPGDSETRLHAMSATCHLLGEVTVPIDLRIFEVGRDYVVGAYEDTTGEPHVAVYRLHRNP